MMEKPYAPSCDRNQEVILQIFKEFFPKGERQLLEIGSGTGQHAVFCAPHFPRLSWLTSEVESNHSGIRMWLNEFKYENINGPIEFEIGESEFPQGDFDIVFTANTLHIMSWEKVQQLIESLGENLKKNALVFIYGAFNYGGKYSSKSNAHFDQWLKQQSSESGIRDFEEVERSFKNFNFKLVADREMPSNNRFLIFSKESVSK